MTIYKQVPAPCAKEIEALISKASQGGAENDPKRFMAVCDELHDLRITLQCAISAHTEEAVRAALAESRLAGVDRSATPACDCIEMTPHGWVQRCDCQNSGDLAAAAVWCEEANTARADGEPTEGDNHE